MDFAIAGLILSTLILVVSCLGTGRNYYRDATNPAPRNFTDIDISILADQVLEKLVSSIEKEPRIIEKIAETISNNSNFSNIFKTWISTAIHENLKDIETEVLGADENYN